MNILMQNGTVAATTKLPKFEDLFPSLINPLNIVLYDSFLSNTGVLNGRKVEKSPNPKNWTTFGSAVFTVNPIGYVTMTNAAMGRSVLEHKTAGKLYARIEVGENTSHAGIIFRSSDHLNLIQVSLSVSLNAVYIQKYIAGVQTVISSTPKAYQIGRGYDLTVEYDETHYVVSVDGVKIVEIQDSDLSANTKVGISTGSTLHKHWEFVAS